MSTGSGAQRIVIVVAVAVVVAFASFADRLATIIGIAAVGAAGVVVVFVLIGAFVSLGRDRESLPASNRLPGDKTTTVP